MMCHIPSSPPRAARRSNEAMGFVGLILLAAAFLLTAPAWAGPSLDWGMWLGHFLMIIPLALLIVAVVALVRWLGSRDSGVRVRTARDILDERYARGESRCEEYPQRSDQIAGRS